MVAFTTFSPAQFYVNNWTFFKSLQNVAVVPGEGIKTLHLVLTLLSPTLQSLKESHCCQSLCALVFMDLISVIPLFWDFLLKRIHNYYIVSAITGEVYGLKKSTHQQLIFVLTDVVSFNKKLPCLGNWKNLL